MKLKIFFLILLIPLTVYGNGVEDCDEENNLSKIAKGFTYPNCVVPENINNFQTRKPGSLCDTCKKGFELIHGKKISENTKHIQEDFLNSSLNEYKKNLTNNLLNALKSKTMFGTGTKFSKSIVACKFKTPTDFMNGCNSKAARDLLSNSSFFDSLEKELKNEVARFLSTDPSFDPQITALKRNKQTCHIPEKDLALFANATFEEALSKEMIEYIKKVDPKKFSSIGELFSSDDFIESFGDASDLKVSLANHPLFQAHMKDVGSLVSFMKKIPSPSETNNLRSILYSKENGDQFDANLASSCDTSFKALKNSLCSTEFDTGKLFNDPMENYSKLPISSAVPTENELAATESLIDSNIKLLELCENKDSADRKKLSLVNLEIGSALQENQRPLSLEVFKTTKYESEIGNLTNSLCKMTDQSCISGTLTCSIYQKYKSQKDLKSKPAKPSDFAQQSNDELIRSMITYTKNVDPETYKILIAEGVLPKEDGKFVEKPEMKDTQQEFFAKLPAPKITQPSFNSSTKNVVSSQAGINQPSTNSFSNNSASTTTPSAPAGDMDDISDLVRGSTEDIKDIQDEIKRRLGNLPPNKPATIEDAKKIARDTFKNKGRKITPYQEQALAERMLQPAVPNSVSAANTNSTNPNSPTVSDTETQSEKWRNGLKDKALMGMQGAQQVLAKDAANSRGPASVDAKPKDLTKVALNIAEDPKVKLSDIFASKIDQNDPETQLLKVLLKSKNNFLLQIKDMNFKIVFDGNNFNVLLESGDRAAAERMRPQLEIFLKRLKT